MAPMKLAKMMPKGRALCWCARRWEDLSAGDQKKMNRYMEPSKQQEVRPRVRTCLSTASNVSMVRSYTGKLDWTDLQEEV